MTGGLVNASTSIQIEINFTSKNSGLGHADYFIYSSIQEFFKLSNQNYDGTPQIFWKYTHKDANTDNNVHLFINLRDPPQYNPSLKDAVLNNIHLKYAKMRSDEQ